MSERIFWDSIDDSEFKSLYLPFVLPVLSGIPAVAGYDRNCGEDTIGAPLKGDSGYGYDAYIGVDPVLEPCSQGFKGYFVIQQVDGVATIKKHIVLFRIELQLRNRLNLKDDEWSFYLNILIEHGAVVIQELLVQRGHGKLLRRFKDG